MITHLSKSELKSKSGGDFQNGDIVCVGKYAIHIERGVYSSPAMKSWVEDMKTGKTLSCWPAGVRGCWPYFVADFLHRGTNLPQRTAAEHSVEPTRSNVGEIPAVVNQSKDESPA